jgi:hypothetical protein
MTKIQYQGYTDHLNRRTAKNICHAFDFAAYLGYPLNNYIVMNLHGLDAEYAASLFERVRHKFRDWFNRRTKQLYGKALPPMYVYTLEKPGQQAHANWVVHIPTELKREFDKKKQRWVERVQGKRGHHDIYASDVDPHTAKSLAKYIIKGIDAVYVDYLHLSTYAAPQGRIWGRRAGTSPSLSRGARNAGGFSAKRDRGKLRPANIEGKAAA